MKHAFWIWAVAVCTFLIGFLGYAALSADYSYQQAMLQIRALSRTLVTENAMLYGTVVSIDPTRHTISIKSIDQYAPTTEPLLVLLAVTPLTLIMRQELQGGMEYSFLSSPSLATLADIPVGSRVKLYYDRFNQARTARVIFFGNPL